MSDRINRLTAQLRAGILTPSQWATALHADRHGHDHDHDPDHDHGDGQAVPSRDYQMMVACRVCAEGVAKGDEEQCGKCGGFMCHDHWQVVDSEPMCDTCREERGLYECSVCETWCRDEHMLSCEHCDEFHCDDCDQNHNCQAE